MEKETLRAAWAEIDCSAIRYNIRNIRKAAGAGAIVIGVIKADAYGHGAVRYAEILREEGVDHFAVATLEEALELRAAGAEEPIIILGPVPDECAEVIVANGLSPVISDLASAEALSDAAVRAGKVIGCLLAVDTGMGRIGYRSDDPASIREASEEIRKMDELPGIRIVTLISHFATSDEEDREYTRRQLRLFNDFYDKLASDGVSLKWKSIANSAAIMEYSCAHFDAVRPGIILYGCYPSDAVHKEKLDLKPVMSVKAKITHLKTVPAGTAVSYGRKFVAERESRIATIGLGYADGYSRVLTGRAEVLLHGHRAPVVGSICMDQCMVDVTDIPDARKGDVVTVMGRDGEDAVTAEELGRKIGTINYEVLCCFGMRLPKVYTHQEERD